MKRERILVTVKTYPTLSKSHIELVCTAGFREDGSWIRIYPIPFRLLGQDSQFSKWTWIELPIRRRAKDKRPESYSPTDRNDIIIGERISSAHDWEARRTLTFAGSKIWSDLQALIEAGKRNELSLATFKPAKMINYECEAAKTKWNEEKLAVIEAQLRQKDLLESDSVRENFQPADQIPFNFYYRFEDENGHSSRLRILDWEIGMLYRNCLSRNGGDVDAALEGVRLRYETEFFEKDLHLFLGTTLEWHDRAPNPWVIIGVVPFPVKHQLDLF